MSKQTAVEWLQEQLFSSLGLNLTEHQLKMSNEVFFKQALEMEEEQKIDACENCVKHFSITKEQIKDFFAGKQPETIIDWSRVPKGFDWVAMDKDGIVCAFLIEPYILESTSEWISDAAFDMIASNTIPNPPKDWKQCKFKRP